MNKYYYTSLIAFFVLFSLAIGFVLYRTKPSWVMIPNINGDKYDWYNLILLSLLGGLTLSLIVLIVYTPDRPKITTSPSNKNKSTTQVHVKPVIETTSNIF
jgi:hypothetical protein